MSPNKLLLALSLLAAAAARTFAGADPFAALPRSAPEEEGVSSAALLGFVQAAEKDVHSLHSFMLLRHGRVVAEGWWAPYAASEPHSLFSLSKGFTSTAVGLAIAEGKLSLSDPVLKFFPEEAPAAPSRNLMAMRVRDLLRMCTGQRVEDIQSFSFQSKQDLVRAFLEIAVVDKPGSHFVYGSSASYMLSAIVQKVTGQTVLEYLRPRLFEPLGIARPAWEASAQGISLGGTGLSVRTEDIARFGQLYLQNGEWHGRQLIPADWVRAATALQTSNGSDPNSDWEQGYGYQFWRCTHGFFRGDGAFGQFCVVMPEFDAVIAITSGTKDLPGVLELVWNHVLPGFSAAALPADPASDRKLAERLAGLSLETQAGQGTSPIGARIAGRKYVFPENPQKVELIAIEPDPDGSAVTFEARFAGADQRITCSRGRWSKGILATVSAGPIPIAANGAWTSDDTYTAVLCRYRTPITTTYDMRFSGDQLILEMEDNVGLGGVARIRLVGKAAP